MAYWDKLAKLKSKPKVKIDIRLMGRPTMMGTGAGADGIVNPHKAVGVDFSSGKPVVVHEGETIADYGDKRVVYPHGMLNVRGQMPGLVMANDENQQNDLDEAQRKLALPGMETGGVINKQNQIIPNINPLNIGQLTEQNSTKTIQPTQITPTLNPLINGGGLTLNSTNTTTPSQVSTNTTTNPLADNSLYNNYQNNIDKSIDLLKGVQSGNNSVFDMQNTKALNRLGMSQAENTSAQNQKMAQAGLSQEAKNVLNSNANRQQELTRGQVTGQLAEAEANAQIGASKDVASMSQAQKDEIWSKQNQEVQALLAAGGEDNVKKAEEISKGMFGFDIDMSKALLPDIQSAEGNISKWLDTYGASADPKIVQGMAKKLGDLKQKEFGIMGVSFTPEDLTGMQDSLISGTEPSDSTKMQNALHVGTSMMDWWTDGDGSGLQNMLSPEYQNDLKILSNPNVDQEQKAVAGQNVGKIISLAYYASNGFPLQDAQLKTLSDAGLTMLSGDINSKMTSDIQSVISGENADTSKLVSDKDAYQTALKLAPDVSTPDETVVGAGRDKRAIAPMLDSAKDSGGIVQYKGNLYKVIDSNQKKANFSTDPVTYTLKNVTNGNVVSYKTSKDVRKHATGSQVGFFTKLAGLW